MVVPLFETLSFIIGIIYGYSHPGREDRGRLFRNGLMIGVVLGLIFAGLGFLVGSGLLILSGLGIFIEIIILTVLFIIGTWIGDWLEGRSKAARVVPAR